MLIVPQTRQPIQVGLNRLISFSPSTIAENKRETLDTYQWNLVDLENQAVNLSQSAGKVAIINLWATWCPPCIAEMPSFQKLYDDYGNRVDFYFISAEEPEKIQKFFEKREFDMPVYRPLEAAPAQLNSASLPTTFVLSREGEIVISKTGSANWNDHKFRELLDEMLAAKN